MNRRSESTTRQQPPGSVRIIGGRWKRSPIVVADVSGLRPTADRVRETLFNWLAHLRPDGHALRGLDLFAGTGALGFELASRGAAHVTLVEQSTMLVARLRALQQKLAATQVEILAGDAIAIAARLPAASFDVIFLDPPFDSGLAPRALAASRRLLAPGGLVYVERSARDGGEVLADWDTVRELRAGQVYVCLLQARIAE
jgi:16S rRNA (guanine966-N2)-methyltransferase